jgi:hypothetical protein
MDRMTPSFAPSSLVSPFARLRLARRGNRLGFAEMGIGTGFITNRLSTVDYPLKSRLNLVPRSSFPDLSPNPLSTAGALEEGAFCS